MQLVYTLYTVFFTGENMQCSSRIFIRMKPEPGNYVPLKKSDKEE